MTTNNHYTLIKTSRGNDPAVVVVNSSLRTFKNRENFSWHLKLNITCEIVGANGMPTRREIEVLDQLEEKISTALEVDKNSLFLARITCRGARDLLYRVHDPEIANEALQNLIDQKSQLREWDYRMEQDLSWMLADPELKLLERDPRFN